MFESIRYNFAIVSLGIFLIIFVISEIFRKKRIKYEVLSEIKRQSNFSDLEYDLFNEIADENLNNTPVTFDSSTNLDNQKINSLYVEVSNNGAKLMRQENFNLSGVGDI